MSRWSAGSQSALREANTAKIVEAVSRFGGLTQVELTEATGLSAATVSAIVKELSASGVVETRPTSRSGRRAQMVTMARRAGLVVAVGIGLRSMRVRIADAAHDVVAERAMPLPAEHAIDTVLDRAALLIVDMLELVGADTDELVGVCLSLPAPIDPATGMTAIRGILRGWDDSPIAEPMSRRLGCPVLVENDANLAAIAEAARGAARGVTDSVAIRASFGASAGIIIGGRLHTGYAGTAGEIGHVQVDPQGAICRCGLRGCLNTVIGSEALLAPLREAYGSLTYRDVVLRAAEGDAGCARVVADAATALGTATAALCQIVNPEVVTVGGEMLDAGDVFLTPFTAAVHDATSRHRARPLTVCASDVHPDADLVGGVIHMLDSTDVLQRFEERV